MITDDILEQNEGAIEALRPSTPTYKRSFDWAAPDGNVRRYEYVQAQLGMFPAQEFMTMLTRVLRDLVDGKYGVNVGELIGRGTKLKAQIPSEFSEDTVNQTVADNIQFIQAFLHVMEIVPGLQEDIIALSLGVSRDRDVRKWFKSMITEPPHKGGLTVDEGVLIIKTFVQQNGAVIRRFLEDQVQEIVEAVLEAINPPTAVDSTVTATETEEDSGGGRPSSTSSHTTPASA